MNQEQESRGEYIFPEKQELEKQFKTYKSELEHKQIKNEEFLLKIKALEEQLLEIVSKTDVDKKFYIYCKEHYPNLIKLCQSFKKRLWKKDVHCSIEGETGSGKSVLGLCINMLLGHMLDKRFRLDKNVAYKPKQNELSARMEGLKEYELLMIDETISSLYKLYTWDINAIKSNHTVQEERFRHNIVTYCIPNFNHLLKDFRDTNIKFRLWVIGTNPPAAVLWVKEKHPALVEEYGAWHTKQRVKALKNARINPLSTTEEYLFVERKVDNTVMDVSWPDLENIPEFSYFHLCYEVMKYKSRLISKMDAINNMEEPKNLRQDKLKKVHLAEIKELLILHPEATPKKYLENKEKVLGEKYPLTLKSVQRRFAEAKRELGVV